MSSLRVTPLHSQHLALGARLVEFAGYEMPVQYRSVIAECLAVRQGAGMFDVSHMARLTFTGPDAADLLVRTTTNDVPGLAFGSGHYSLLTNAQGGTVDDLIIYHTAPQEFRLVVNASNHAKDVAHFQSQNHREVPIRDLTAETALIAVQGPRAVEVLRGLADQPHRFDDAPLFAAFEVALAGIPVFAMHSGYTGEDGYELVVAAADAARMWNVLHATGVEPCGLGARDALRVEAGLPLYGHELDDERSPIEAGLGWVVRDSGGFLGEERILRDKREGTAQRLMGVRLAGKRLAQIGQEVLVEGARVGTVSSGVYSPTLECGLAFAFVDSGIKAGTPCTLDFRGKQEMGTIVSKRFLKKSDGGAKRS